MSSDQFLIDFTDKSTKKPKPKQITCHRFHPPTLPPSSPNAASSASSPIKLIFTHGAGGSMTAAAASKFCIGFSHKSNNQVLGFNGFAHLMTRTKYFHRVIQAIGESVSAAVIGGRSLGSRAAVLTASSSSSSSSSYVAAAAANQEKEEDREDQKEEDQESEVMGDVKKVICVSYPLRPAAFSNKPSSSPSSVTTQLRDQILLDAPSHLKILFIIGSKDDLCPISELQEVRKKMRCESWLVVVQGADHGMTIRARDDSGVNLTDRCLELQGAVAADWAAAAVTGQAETIDESEKKNEKKEKKENKRECWIVVDGNEMKKTEWVESIDLELESDRKALKKRVLEQEPQHEEKESGNKQTPSRSRKTGTERSEPLSECKKPEKKQKKVRQHEWEQPRKSVSPSSVEKDGAAGHLNPGRRRRSQRLIKSTLPS